MSTPRTLPILDFSQFRAGGRAAEDFLAELRTASREIGFFYLAGHGVPAKLQSDIFQAGRDFFALDEADKLAIEMVNSPHFRGYTRAGQELTRGAQDWREQIDVGSELPTAQPDPDAPWLRLRGPNLWPEKLPTFKPTVLAWQRELTRLAIELLQAFALSLGQDRDVFSPIYRDQPNEHLKIIRYPGRDATESEQGVGAHKDSGFLTLLLQDEIGGLQVETDDGQWIHARPIADTFVVNIGEILELPSNGYPRATVHRVVTPPAGHDRLSVAYFFDADLNARVPLLELPSERAAEARGVTSDPQNPLFYEVGRNYLKGRLRSHPDVAQRHYADILRTTTIGAAASIAPQAGLPRG
jgi:isopenicillin N synthase-like dioxygenase